VAQLLARRTTLDRRWETLTVALRSTLGLKRDDLQIDADYHSGGVSAGLVGRACERIVRNRGISRVVPLHRMSEELFAWLDFQEVWNTVPGSKPFAFRQLSLTVHFGHLGDPIKPQAFRAEWAGATDWGSGSIGFQSPGAGHPHWQIDVLETLRSQEEPVDFGAEPADAVERFLPDRITVDTLLRSVTLERIHFASAADWWKPPPTAAMPPHIHAPKDEVSLTRWILACVSYVKQELGRCDVD
jgi:hypothetical protein